MFRVEKKIIDWFKKNYLILFVIVMTIFAVLIRVVPLKFQSNDYIGFLNPWFEDLKAKGGFPGLATYIGNYNAPYMTIMAFLTYLPVASLYTIKAVSIFFDFVLAVSAAYLVSMLVKKNKKVFATVAYTLVLFMPQVVLNSSMWAQCDSIYGSFTIIALILLLKEKYWQSFVFLGIAFSFKLQFVFILPVFIIMYICKNKFSILNFLIIPIVNFIMCLPAIIIGKPISELLKVYFGQASSDPALVRNYPNIYYILSNDIQDFKLIGIIITIIILGLLLFYFIYKNVKWNNDKIFVLTLMVFVVVTYTLPGMHERYMYVGEVLSIMYYLMYKKNLPIVLMVNFNALVTYSVYLTGFVTDMLPLISIVYGVVIVYFVVDTLKNISDSKEVKYE